MKHAEDNPWPASVFHFSVDLGDVKGIPFREVSGVESQSAAALPVRKFPASDFPPIITLKKGIVKNDPLFRALYAQMHESGQAGPMTVLIRLQDGSGKQTMSWTIDDALIRKIMAVASGDEPEIALEKVALNYSHISTKQPMT